MGNKDFDIDEFIDQEYPEDDLIAQKVVWYTLEERTPMFNEPILFITQDKQPRFGTYTLEKDLDGTIYADHPWREASNQNEETITLYRKDLVSFWMPYPKLPGVIR